MSLSDNESHQTSPYVLNIRQQPQRARVGSDSRSVQPSVILQLHLKQESKISGDDLESANFGVFALLGSADLPSREITYYGERDDAITHLLRGDTVASQLWCPEDLDPANPPPPVEVAGLPTPVFFVFNYLTIHQFGEYRLIFRLFQPPTLPTKGASIRILASITSWVFPVVKPSNFSGVIAKTELERRLENAGARGRGRRTIEGAARRQKADDPKSRIS